jgi:GAF domain-containing protein
MNLDSVSGVETAERRLAAFAGMAHEMSQPRDLEGTLQSVLEQARRTGIGDAVGILLVEGRSITAAAASEPAVTTADLLQLECGEGTGVEAIMRCRGFLSNDLGLDPQWATWGPQAAQLGLRSVLSVRLAHGDTLGALSIYAREPMAFGSEDLAVAEVFAAHASVAVAMARQRESLQKAINARHLIGQAQGILMARYDIDAEQAFDVLRRYSSHGNQKLRQIAAEVVQLRRLPADPTSSSRD